MVQPLSLGQGRERVLFIPMVTMFMIKVYLASTTFYWTLINFTLKEMQLDPKMMTFDLNTSSSILIY